jgi:hypothetical protein
VHTSFALSRCDEPVFGVQSAAMSKTRPTHLGDAHNFGRRVSEREGCIVKPRTVFWEWLFLSRESPLRQILVSRAEADGLAAQTFDFLPDLKFVNPRARDGGEVQRIVLEPLPTLSPERKRELASIVGRSLALWSWFGVADLHWENLVLGVDIRGQIVFTPLDIEMVLADLSLPTETKLLPDADPEVAEVCRHAAGVRRVLPYLGKPIDAGDLLAMASTYFSTLVFLDRHARDIAKVFADLPELQETPIRICLRGTDEYVNADAQSIWPPLLDAEKEQLARGDIPYFFRLYEKPGIHWYGNRELTEINTLPTEGDMPQLDPILQVSRGFRSKSRKTLREEGFLTVIGAFDHKSFKGVITHDGLEVTFQKNTLLVQLPDGEEIEAHRDLSEFVGSVYLSCHCGEVLSVFVPKVTVCERG